MKLGTLFLVDISTPRHDRNMFDPDLWSASVGQQSAMHMRSQSWKVNFENLTQTGQCRKTMIFDVFHQNEDLMAAHCTKTECLPDTGKHLVLMQFAKYSNKCSSYVEKTWVFHTHHENPSFLHDFTKHQPKVIQDEMMVLHSTCMHSTHWSMLCGQLCLQIDQNRFFSKNDFSHQSWVLSSNPMLET
jgi:hypothetical protein